MGLYTAPNILDTGIDERSDLVAGDRFYAGQPIGRRRLAAARRLGLPLTVAYADLDNIKAIKDRFGH